MAVPLERRAPTASGGRARDRETVDLPVEVNGARVTVAGRTLDAPAIRSVAVVRRPGRGLLTWGPAVATGLVVAIAGYVVLSRVLPGPAAHALGLLVFLLAALAAGVRVAVAVRRALEGVIHPAYQLRVDCGGAVSTLAEDRDFGVLKRAEAAILRSLGDAGWPGTNSGQRHADARLGG